MPAWLHRRRQSIQKTTLLSLPTEIYLEILEYLDVASEICLRLACRRLYLALPSIPNVKLNGIKSDICNQIFGRKACLKCNIVFGSAAFPQWVDTPPDLQRIPHVTRRHSMERAVQNAKRIGLYKARMKLHGLVYASPAPKKLPVASSWPDNSNKRLKWSTTRGKYIQCRLPRGGWVHVYRNGKSAHLFEYRGFCGWVYQGFIPFGRNRPKWIFHCECLRCSPILTDAHKICFFCDPNDSRYILNTETAFERNLSNASGVRPGRICLSTSRYCYGEETSWVGRRKNTCMRDTKYHGRIFPFQKKFNNDLWLPYEMPSWEWSWCGACSSYYTPGPNSRKKKDHEGWNDPALWGIDQCRRRCTPHRLNPHRKLILEEQCGRASGQPQSRENEQRIQFL